MSYLLFFAHIRLKDMVIKAGFKGFSSVPVCMRSSQSLDPVNNLCFNLHESLLVFKAILGSAHAIVFP